MRIKIFVILTLFIQVFKGNAQEYSDTLYLDIRQVVDLVIANNPDLKRVQLNESILESQIAQAKSAAYPQVKGSARYTDNFALPQQLLPGEIFGQTGQIPVTFGVRYGLNAGVEVNQLIYSKEYLTNRKKLDAAKATYQLQTLASKEDLIYQVVRLYMQSQISQEQKQILDANLLRVNQLIEIAEAQFENGIIKKLDVDQLKVNRTNLNSELLNLEIGSEQILSYLKFYLDLDQSQPIVLVNNPREEDPNLISENLLLNQNIQYRLLQEQDKLLELENKVINAAYYPTITAFAQYNYTGQSDKFSLKSEHYSDYTAGAWGLNISVPIFDGFQRKNRLQQNAIAQEQLQLSMKQLSNAANLDFQNAKNTVLKNEQLVTTQLENMKLAQELYDVTKLSYQEGVAPLTELTNAETSFKEAQSQYLTALLNLKMAELEQLKVSGKLAELIQINNY